MATRIVTIAIGNSNSIEVPCIVNGTSICSLVLN